MPVCGEVIERREAALVAALKGAGLRLTHQRLEVVRELAAAHDHPDADELCRRVRGRVPTISLDTVYRTLAVFVDRGLVARVTTPRATRFDPDLAPHHHFVCTSCGELYDVPPRFAAVRAVEAIPGVGRVRTVCVEFHGVCAACGARETP